MTDPGDPLRDPPARRRRLPEATDLLAAALLLLLPLLFHAELAFDGDTVTWRDLGPFFGPLREIAFREILAGRLPLWNDASLSGLPLLASPNSALANPFTWLWPLGGARALVLGLALALPLAGFVALRLAGFAALPALAGGAFLFLSGPARSSAAFPPMFSCLVFLPLFLAALHGAIEGAATGGEAQRRRLAAVALLLALLLTAGEPAVAAQGLLLALPLLALAAPLRRPGPRRRLLGGLLLAGAIAVLLASVQLLPTLRQFPRSARGAGLAAETGPLWWSLPPLRLATLAWPGLYGNSFSEEAADDWSAPFLDGGGSYLPTITLGVVPLLLAAAGTVRRTGRIAIGVAALFLLLATGRHTPLGPWLVDHLPGMTAIRYPEKWVHPATLSLLFAGVLGLSLVSRRRDPDGAGDGDRARRRLASAALLLGMAFLATFAAARLAPDAAATLLARARIAPPPLAPRAVEALAVDSLVGLALAAATAGSAHLARGARHRAATAAFLVLLGTLDLFARHRDTLPTRPAGSERAGDPASAALLAAAGGRPVYYDPEWSGASTAAAALDAGGADPAQPLRGVFLGLTYAGNNEVDRMGPRHAVAWAATTARLPWGAAKLARLESAGVGAILTLADLDAAPGLERVRFDGWSRSARRVYRVLDPRPAGRLVVDGREVAGAEPLSRLPIAERWRVDVPDGGALFVRARTFDPDLVATLDGRRLPIALVDEMFTGVRLPPGSGTLALDDRNPAVPAGIALSLLGLAGLAALAVRPGRRP